jgi:hypothetical protein
MNFDLRFMIYKWRFAVIQNPEIVANLVSKHLKSSYLASKLSKI